jgi:hypothetical protein
MDLLTTLVLVVGVFLASFVVALGIVDFLHPVAGPIPDRFSLGRTAKRRGQRAGMLS